MTCGSVARMTSGWAQPWGRKEPVGTYAAGAGRVTGGGKVSADITSDPGQDVGSRGAILPCAWACQKPEIEELIGPKEAVAKAAKTQDAENAEMAQYAWGVGIPSRQSTRQMTTRSTS
jgi:hypothetical protein